MKLRILSIIIIFFTLIGSKIVLTEDDPGWLSYSGDRITIIYPVDINLRKLEARLRSRWFSVSAVEKDRYTNSAYSVEQRIIARLESILLRAKQILAMDPAVDLKLKIFSNRNELGDEYLRLMGAPGNYKSFYIHGFRTIYSSMQDISDSEISHEMAHAVVDNYFRVPPPGKTAELLATYVDSHLEKE